MMQDAYPIYGWVDDDNAIVSASLDTLLQGLSICYLLSVEYTLPRQALGKWRRDGMAMGYGDNIEHVGDVAKSKCLKVVEG